MSLVAFLDNSQRSAGVAAPPDSRATRFHRSMPGYAPTAVAEAPAAAAELGLSRLVVKLETERFGLPSFKLLGASWAICRALSLRAGVEPAATFDELRRICVRLDGLTLVAATDGNHGRAVAHMARLLGLGARILVPEHTAQARVDAIAGEGATVDIVRGSYDDAVGQSAGLASDDHLVISDTSWPGYEEVPGWVAEGYATIFEELAEQLPGELPPLVAIQIGVGALASAAVRALAAPGRVLVGVEPGDAACVLHAVRAGRPVLVPGPHISIMAGLNCGLASRVALPDMAAGIDAFCAIDDRATEQAVRLLLRDGLTCGETGAAGVAGLLALREDRPERMWERLRLADPRPAALAICTEAPTDPPSFARIAAGA
ncbi:MAG: Diaminopropionate ammonia-lyase [uncultured Solirubrobacteraceae bacterium]|uniref:Diaminopropionate ammonia-lyase n=1 Tax=uncultured Solirubrobacteraceae bacterium TaxID=1162706 RepID=A0A6J4S3V4_9ACTN|nr:MAG: Diaminopropionate ammonia-lyase [uncultured Solirubrobacteraceae bacterium]